MRGKVRAASGGGVAARDGRGRGADGCWRFRRQADAQARAFVGPGKCTDCHDHRDEKEWSEKRDGDGRGKQHINALNQLADPKSDGWAKAIGLADPYDVRGTCVKCHATVVRGSPDFGISCESCHGAGRDYLQPHQEKGAYEKSHSARHAGRLEEARQVGPRLHDLSCARRQPDRPQAGRCRSSDGRELHGRDEVHAGRGALDVEVHGQSDRCARRAGARRLLARVKHDRAGHGCTPSATRYACRTAARLRPQRAGAATATPPPPPPGGGATVAPPSGGPTATPRPAQPTGPRTSPGLPRTVAPVATEPPAASAEVAVAVTLPPDPVLPPTPAGIVASIQGRLIGILDTLLSRAVTTPTRVTPPERKTVYRGADAELLRLQDEVIALALEALGSAPAPAPPPQQ